MSREKIESLMHAMNQSHVELSISEADGEAGPTGALRWSRRRLSVNHVFKLFGSRLRIVLGGSMFDNASPRSNYERRVPSV
jgi:hypothetical protein